LATVSDTSPLLYLYRAGCVEWLAQIFTDVLIPSDVQRELEEGRRLGYDVPDATTYSWAHVTEPASPLAQEIALGLGMGERSALALTIEHRERILLLDDALARRTARQLDLSVWGTLRVLLEAKKQGLTDEIAPIVSRLTTSGMWLSEDVRQRILHLSGES
jgi:predicted nucleic acid-binding protein